MKDKTINDTRVSTLPTLNEAQQAPESDQNGIFGPVIYSYTRAQAIQDGVLVDVSAMAREAGFVYPVAMTSAAWKEAVTVSPTDGTQDESGRLWDVLNVLRFTIKSSHGGSKILFLLSVCDEGERTRTVELKSVCGPGDNAEPVVTIMLPDED